MLHKDISYRVWGVAWGLSFVMRAYIGNIGLCSLGVITRILSTFMPA